LLKYKNSLGDLSGTEETTTLVVLESQGEEITKENIEENHSNKTSIDHENNNVNGEENQTSKNISNIS
jgi:hypothetical protein